MAFSIQYKSQKGWRAYKALWPNETMAQNWACEASKKGVAHRVLVDGKYTYYRDGEDVTR
jgi:hypothetical protein